MLLSSFKVIKHKILGIMGQNKLQIALQRTGSIPRCVDFLKKIIPADWQIRLATSTEKNDNFWIKLCHFV